MKLAFGAITRNSDEAILRRCLASVKDGVDSIYVTVGDHAGPSDGMKRLAEDFGAHLSHFPWCDDFAAARNFNMGQVNDADWYVWADSDDEVRGMDKAREFLRRLPKHIDFVLCPYEYSYFPSGEPDVVHPKERFIRIGRGFAWKGKLHETCVSEEKRDGVKFEDAVWMHRTDAARSLESSVRNIRIITAEIKEQAESGKVDPRTLFNLGMALASKANVSQDAEDWTQVVRAFHDYLGVGGFDMHAYMAWKFIGEAYMRLGRNDLALDAFFECLKLDPGIRDARSLLGSAYLNMKDDKKAEAWFHMALLCGNDNGYATDRGVSFVVPLIGLAEINGRRGKLDDAKQFLEMAKKHVGKNEAVDGMLEGIKEIKRAEEDARTVVDNLEKLHADKQEAAYDAVPEHVKAHPLVTGWRRKRSWKKSTAGNELTVFCGHSWEEWTPDTSKTGIGGSEEAVIEMAKRLKALGWDVTVYGRHGAEPKEYDGVMYRPYWQWMPHEPVDVFVGWRDPRVFDMEINAKRKYLWLHDAYADHDITELRRKNLDKVIVLSRYHRSLFPSTPDDKIFLSSNGITPSHFDRTDVIREPHSAFYGSAPDRGLECLLKMWPSIREKVPDAKLYWAYGWETYKAAHANNPVWMRWMQSMQEMLRQPGVEEMGRVSHEKVAEMMMRCGVWTYPTLFNEINCITARKAQAGGAIPVHSSQYAIGEPELTKFGYSLDLDNVYFDKEQQEKFINATVEAMSRTDFPRDDMRAYAKEAFDWDGVARQWTDEFKANL